MTHSTHSDDAAGITSEYGPDAVTRQRWIDSDRLLGVSPPPDQPCATGVRASAGVDARTLRARLEEVAARHDRESAAATAASGLTDDRFVAARLAARADAHQQSRRWLRRALAGDPCEDVLVAQAAHLVRQHNATAASLDQVAAMLADDANGLGRAETEERRTTHQIAERWLREVLHLPVAAIV